MTGHSAKIEMYLRIPVHAVLQDEATVRWKDIELVSVVDGDVYSEALDRLVLERDEARLNMSRECERYSIEAKRRMSERDEARKLAERWRDMWSSERMELDPLNYLLPWEETNGSGESCCDTNRDVQHVELRGTVVSADVENECEGTFHCTREF